ncbi:MAG: CoA transferase [Chloroflexi bacterium]|jgi:crotonobetainyl-CoA:carnitine CoA-transferase CaiB-like acyl-CoA transferase|nr:CoA transferase [Dehalococcoidia bacterium]MCO5200591.1 CoA transferase [Chloroflexota bacterium]MCZ7578384.1 CoA transferase [Dehalococcoidia bacterium]
MAEALKQPFAGLRVADFAWVGVGPIVSKYLADHGAEVVRIESSTYPEALRRVGPFVDGQPGIDRSGYYANFNSSKLGATVNLKHPRGPELIKRFIATCDVVTESFTPGTMAKFGLDYDSLRQLRPDLLMISMPLYGQTGPWANYMGYGHVLQAAAGYNHMTGWPDQPPIGTGVAYTDFLVPHLAATALIAALDYRRRTGKGQYIDFSQMEAAVHGLGTAILDWTANGHEQIRLGNHDMEAAPHNAYKCRDGRWIAIACTTEKHWEGLKAALGRPEWCDMDRMRRRWQRINELKEIDRHLGYWFEDFTRLEQEPALQAEEGVEAPPIRKFTTQEVVELMQSFGVPCGIVQSPEAMHADPQLAHRGHYWKLQHPVMGLRTYDGPAFRLSKTPTELRKAAPCLGEDNEYVFKEVVGLSEDEFIELLAGGAFE